MNPLRKLASQTAIYGLSSMVGRFINYLLVFIHTRVFLPEQFGVITGIYSYITFLWIIFTYGMETAYFKFATGEKVKGNAVYSTSFLSVTISSFLFLGIILLCKNPLSELIRVGEHPEYIVWFGLILALDAITSIPFVHLRLLEKPVKFVSIKLTNIFLNVFFNLFFLLWCPSLYKSGNAFITSFYNPSIGVGYVFLANLLASSVTLLLLLPDIIKQYSKADYPLWKRMMLYALPLLPAGLAGMINETLDRIMLLRMIPNKENALFQTGIYGANYKLSILMTLFIQTFRFAAEPFFFSHAEKANAKETYARVMKYFVIICIIIFLGVTLYIDVAKLFIGKHYHEGLHVVPVLLLANLFVGIYINLSIWYKLTGQTQYGLYLAIFGAAITVLLNYLWIPIYGYTGSAWATLICYFLMMVASYFYGQKHYPVNYDLKRIGTYFLLMFAAYLLFVNLRPLIKNEIYVYSLSTVILTAFLGAVYFLERGKKIVHSSPLNSF